MNQKWNPLTDRVLVLQDWGPEYHPNKNPDAPRVAIPQPLREKQRPNTGVIAAVGPGRRYDDGQVYPLALQKGQRVMFAPAETLTKVQHDGQDHLMMREQDVFLVLDKPATTPPLGLGVRQSASIGAIIEGYKANGQRSATFSGLRSLDEAYLRDSGCTITHNIDKGRDDYTVSWE